MADVALARGVGLGVVDGVGVPTRRRNGSDDISALFKKAPKGIEVANAARKTNGQADNGEGFITRGTRIGVRLFNGWDNADSLGECGAQEDSDAVRRGMIEGESGRQLDARRLL
jgi:hypothetical protein